MSKEKFRNTLDQQLCFAVYSAAQAFAQAYKPILAPLGLTYPQYLVMLLLWERDDRSVKELGEPLHLDSGTLTPLLKRLQSIGYIARGRDPEDERVTRVRLTARGAALRGAAARVPDQILCATGLGIDHLRELRETMKRLGIALRSAGAHARP